jgi:hypothetical protein
MGRRIAKDETIAGESFVSYNVEAQPAYPKSERVAIVSRFSGELGPQPMTKRRSS